MRCSKCKEAIVPEPGLGQRQGGLRYIVHMANLWKLWLCSKCAQPLFDLYEQYVELVEPDGTVDGAAKLPYVPILDQVEEPPRRRGTKARPAAPTFQG